MGFVFSGMTGGFLVSPFLAGILYAKAGYFPVFILVFATLTFDLFLRASIIEAKTATKYTTSRKHGQKRSEVQPDETSPLIQHEPLPSSEIPATKPRRVSANSNSGSSDESSTTAYGSDTVEQRTTKSEEKPKSLFHPLYWFSKAFPKTAVLLGSPRLSAAVYGCFTYMTVVSSFDATLPLFVKRTFGWGSQGVGLIFLAMTAPALAGAGFGALSDHYGPKKVALFGFGISSLSLAFLSLITDDSLVSKIGLAVLLVLMGLFQYTVHSACGYS